MRALTVNAYISFLVLISASDSSMMDFINAAAPDGSGHDRFPISVEEMVVVTEDGAEWLVPPQEEWVLVPSGP